MITLHRTKYIYTQMSICKLVKSEKLMDCTNVNFVAFYYSVGENLPPQNMSLCMINYFKLVIF